MKKLLTVGILGLLLSSCGLKSECGEDIKMACNLFLGYDPVSQAMVDATDRNVKKLINEVDLQGQINDLIQQQLATLKLRDDVMMGLIDNIFDRLNEQDGDIGELRDLIDSLDVSLGDSLDDVAGRVANLEDNPTDLSSIEEDLVNINEQLSILSDNSIQELYDPCGDDANNPDEILLVMGNGNVVAYFQQGSKRFLTKLGNGNYRTTDKQKCNFTIPLN